MNDMIDSLPIKLLLFGGFCAVPLARCSEGKNFEQKNVEKDENKGEKHRDEDIL